MVINIWQDVTAGAGLVEALPHAITMYVLLYGTGDGHSDTNTWIILYNIIHTPL